KVVTTKMKGSVPETEKFTKVIDEYTYSLFHNIGNVLPLCPNCHALFDGAKYTESDEREIRQLRDEAVRQPEVLEQAIAYIRAELAGRTNRCSHKDEAGDRLHTRRTDTSALGAPLTWVMNGFRRGLDLGDPNIVVNTATPGQHYHVALDRGSVDQCFGTSDSGCSDSELVV
ncbi:hypothetical protein XF35_39540, partial [Streptomyces platensis subsp. clarensis]|nr:hypothetical protein [Streptomyces platensis subsp. clarensis]